MKQERNILATGALLAAIAVIAGAFGAHGLEKLVPAESVASFQTAARYLLIHAVALMGLAALPEGFAGTPAEKNTFCDPFDWGAFIFRIDFPACIQQDMEYGCTEFLRSGDTGWRPTPR